MIESSTIDSITYRFRPLQVWGVASAWGVAIVLGMWLVPGSPPIPKTSAPLLGLLVVAMLLGVGAAFIAGSDVDPGEAITRSMPRRYWVTIVMRLVVWGTLSAVTVLTFTHRTAGAMQTDAEKLLPTAFAHLAFAFALSFAAARAGGSFMGGGASLGVMTLLGFLTWFMESWPIRVFAAPGLERGVASTGWMFFASLAITAGVVTVLARSGVRGPWFHLDIHR